MKLRQLTIKNFKCLVDMTIPIDDTTILIGENNVGKSAILDAIRIVLARANSTRGPVFDEYDYHMCKAGDSPRTSEGIIIELWFREDNPDEWPKSLAQDLNDIIQTDPYTDLDSIGLRLSCKYDEITGEATPKWDFLTMANQPAGGKAARPNNLSTFLQYIRFFYMPALRDANDEFSPRSQFWGRLLRSMKISDQQAKDLKDELTKLNAQLLSADPRLEEVVKQIGEVQEFIGPSIGQRTSLQALPMQAWDLMSKSQLVMKAPGTEIDLPISQFGQGMQSLAVIFLFQAYVKVLLKSLFTTDTEAILALEEPEAHLHPQASRILAANLGKITSQKIISTHSPYFIQEIPFTAIRMLRRTGSSSKVTYIKRRFTTGLPDMTGLDVFCRNNAPKFAYDKGNSSLICNGKIDQKELRTLLKLYSGRREFCPNIVNLFRDSQKYVDDDTLSDLNRWAKQVRGDILFARAWLLCEGQSDYMLIKYFAEVMNKSLDSTGIALIDYQDNGSPGAFVSLARAFEIPWILTCDNDGAKAGFISQVKKCGVSDQECNDLVRPLTGSGVALEGYLYNQGFSKEYKDILMEKGVRLSKTELDPGYAEEIIKLLESDKTRYANSLINKLRIAKIDDSRVPDVFKNAINDIVTKVGA